MTKTLKEIVYSILESIYSHYISDDADISYEWVAAKVVDVNVRLVEESFKQRDGLDSYYQKMCCIEVKCQNNGCTVDGEFIDSGEVLWYAEIPQLNQKIGWKNISYFGLDNLQMGFRRVTMNSFETQGGLDYASRPTYYTAGAKAYFRNLPESGTKFLCLIGILSNPTNACNWDDDTLFPTPDAYKLEIRVKQDILSTFPMMPRDQKNDGQDNLGEMKGDPGNIKVQEAE